MIILIASITENNGIGYRGNLVHRSEEDMSFFKKVTKGNAVIMGRKTFESIGKPLEDRDNIVISKYDGSNQSSNAIDTYKDHISLHDSVESVIREILLLHRKTYYFVIGGASIYNQFLPFASKMLLTKVDTVVEADTFFPEVDEPEWELFNKKRLNSNSVVYTYYRKDNSNYGLETNDRVKLLHDIPYYDLVKGRIGTIVYDYGKGDFEIEFTNPETGSAVVTLNSSSLELDRRGYKL
jgi:dihydrofolate reductase